MDIPELDLSDNVLWGILSQVLDLRLSVDVFEYFATRSDRLHQSGPNLSHLTQVVSELHLVKQERHEEVSFHFLSQN